ncbi:YcgN family cysteine cluster protein [Terrihabitans sp. B22-R8]|uniref:YcgN family cysteine cluster protein n=1 Tax=Terrihabitans sp. B22-R8 TaxID=3425128 RepID=UPI00403C358F
MAERYWKTKTLDEMSPQEWEALCDGCGRCCLVKLEDEDSGAIAYTDVGCTLLDGQSCGCRNYPERQTIVPECVRLTPDVVRTLGWLPATCGYRLVAEGKELPDWHPLVSGDRESVHHSGASVRGKVSASEDDVTIDEILERIVRWPEKWPKRRRRNTR